MSLRCSNVENGLRVGTDGKFYACCLAYSYPYENEKGEILKADSTKFKDALNCHSKKQLKSALDRGEKHPACKVCWEAEDAGFESKRIRDTYRYDHSKLNFKFEDDELFFLELNLGNTCNLACRMCGIHASSSWRNDFQLFNKNLTSSEVNDRVKEFNKVFTDYSKLWDELEHTIKEVRVLDLYGGEPMLMKKQWELLEKCVEAGYSKYQFVHFNTNGTIFNEKYVEILKHFMSVRISFSADGTGEVFDYIRHLGNWNDFENTINKWMVHTKRFSNFSYELTYTTQTLNVLHTHKMAEWILDFNKKAHVNGTHIMHLYVAFVYGPEYYYIGNIPDKLKPYIINKIKLEAEELKKHSEYKSYKYVVDEVLKVAQTLEVSPPCVEEYWEKFWDKNQKLDSFRNQNFSKTLPDLYQLLSRYKNKQLI